MPAYAADVGCRSVCRLRQHTVLVAAPHSSCAGHRLRVDAGVFGITRQNIAALGLPIKIVNTDYHSGFSGVMVPPGRLLITFIAPPWGNALDRTSGLDLRRTMPPISEIVEFLLHRFSQSYVLCAIQVYEIVLPVSMIELRARFEWSTVQTYKLNVAGHNHGILLGSKGWAPHSH